MKIFKIGLGIVFLLFLCYISYYAGGYFLYNKALKKQEDKWLNEIFKQKSFKGIIYQLDKNEKGNCFTNLIISSGQEKFSFGICLCGKNKNFSMFTNVGDSIIKQANTFEIMVLKKVSGATQEFKFPFCN